LAKALVLTLVKNSGEVYRMNEKDSKPKTKKSKKPKVECPQCGKKVICLGSHIYMAHKKEGTVQTAPTKEKTPETIQKLNESEVDLTDVAWVCIDCGVTAPPTSTEGMALLRHNTGHHVQLIDLNTGDVIATSVTDAMNRGIIPKVERLPEAVGKGSETPDSSKFTEQGITFTMTQPAAYFTLFNAGKAQGIIPPEVDLETWNWENAQKRFELDYKFKLMLVPIGEEEE
jgi:hypothetical protein